METNTDLFLVGLEEVGLRLDQLLAKKFEQHSRTYFQELIEKGCVFINGKAPKKRDLLSEGDEIEVFFQLRPQIALNPENIPLEILYEDEHLLAINKPAGMVVHPAPGNPNGTFVNALLYHCSISHHDLLRPGIVHRLDKETSGVLLAAKTEKMHTDLVSLFSKREIKKYYLALLYGHPPEGLIDLPIGRHPKERQKMAVNFEHGKPAQTICTTLKKTSELSFVKLDLLTGRTHQIRVHLKHIGTPVLGDSTYGSKAVNERFKTQRQLLHAHALIFTHPVSKKELVLQAPLPSDFMNLLKEHALLDLKGVDLPTS